MIPEDFEIKSGLLVRHDRGSHLTYEVEDVRRCTNGYEATGLLGGMVVNYTQLEDGDHPAGTKWAKFENGFRQFFTPLQLPE